MREGFRPPTEMAPKEKTEERKEAGFDTRRKRRAAVIAGLLGAAGLLITESIHQDGGDRETRHDTGDHSQKAETHHKATKTIRTLVEAADHVAAKDESAPDSKLGREYFDEIARSIPSDFAHELDEREAQGWFAVAKDEGMDLRQLCTQYLDSAAIEASEGQLSIDAELSWQGIEIGRSEVFVEYGAKDLDDLWLANEKRREEIAGGAEMNANETWFSFERPSEEDIENNVPYLMGFNESGHTKPLQADEQNSISKQTAQGLVDDCVSAYNRWSHQR